MPLSLTCYVFIDQCVHVLHRWVPGCRDIRENIQERLFCFVFGCTFTSISVLTLFACLTAPPYLFCIFFAPFSVVSTILASVPLLRPFRSLFSLFLIFGYFVLLLALGSAFARLRCSNTLVGLGLDALSFLGLYFWNLRATRLCVRRKISSRPDAPCVLTF